MNNVDKAAQIIAEAVGDTMLTDAAAEALADAGLLAPELPEPITPENDPEWAREYLTEWEWVPDAEWHPTNSFFINIKDGNTNAGFWEAQENWEGMNSTNLKAIGLALLAAAQLAEGNEHA